MTFPTPPLVDLPKWCYSGGVYQEPPLSQRESGWVAVPGQNYAEPPPYQWVNWLGYSTGTWLEYLAAYALPYIAAGKFDAGLELYNNQPAKFYNTANDKYTSIKSSPSQSAASVPLVLPPALPATPLPMVSDAAGTMSFSTISSSAVAGITNGSAPINGQVGEYFVFNNNGSLVPVPSGVTTVISVASFGPGVWRFSAEVAVNAVDITSFSTTKNFGRIWLSRTPSQPVPAVNGYNFTGAFTLDVTNNLILPAYYENVSTDFTIYLGCYQTNYINISSNTYFTFTAQRIA